MNDQNTKVNEQVRVQNLIEEFSSLSGSTTFYLERLTGLELNVKILSQTTARSENRDIIRRASALYFTIPEEPLLYCESNLFADTITPEEWVEITKQKPLGKIFSEVTGDTLRKSNLMVEKIDGSLHLNAFLFSAPQTVYKKEYDCYSRDRLIGHIVEFYCEESFMRL